MDCSIGYEADIISQPFLDCPSWIKINVDEVLCSLALLSYCIFERKLLQT